MENTGKLILPIFIVDAFSKQLFHGNGAAVCPVDFLVDVPYSIKQKIAAEMNLSETAFISLLHKNDTFETGKCFHLQWFSPTCEVSLCGHATLASASVLFSVYGNQSPLLEFKTLSGTLTAKKLADGRIEMILPAYDSKHVDTLKYENVIKAAIGSLPYEEVLISLSKKMVIRLKDNITRKQLEELKPNDCDLVAAISDIVGVIVTLKGSGMDDCVNEEGCSYDFISRYFAPWLGISEDPVTGSAHSVLAPFWSRILKKNELYARQCSIRGGTLRMKVTDDSVVISGYYALFLKGHISI